MTELVRKYLEEGLENCDLEKVITAFLLARHACSEGPHVFMTYAQWFHVCSLIAYLYMLNFHMRPTCLSNLYFQETFSDSVKNPASSRKSFAFLMNFLSDIMPFESAIFLKVSKLYVNNICKDICRYK